MRRVRPTSQSHSIRNQPKSVALGFGRFVLEETIHSRSPTSWLSWPGTEGVVELDLREVFCWGGTPDDLVLFLVGLSRYVGFRVE